MDPTMSSYITQELPPEALQLFSILPVDYKGEDNLKLAVAYVHKYLQTQNTHDWFDLRVKAVCFPSFLQAVSDAQKAAADDDDGGGRSPRSTQLLPFSCWCDGGKDYCSDETRSAKFRQHRHLIAVAPKADSHFANLIWARMFCESRPTRRFASKVRSKIQSAEQLVDVLVSLCEGDSDCEFTYHDPAHLMRDRYFYIFKRLPLPVDQCKQKLRRVISDALCKDACKTIERGLRIKNKALTERDREVIREIRDLLNQP